ncbi:MAG: hypothetical protein DRJ52_05115 [Thermoprotei archaeon]|nr:MAG: hypothetical protein DRJ52_05115 [Thermoprotei archaeon]
MCPRRLNTFTKKEVESLIKKRFKKKGLMLYDRAGRLLGPVVKIVVDKKSKRVKKIAIEEKESVREYSAENVVVDLKKGLLLQPELGEACSPETRETGSSVSGRPRPPEDDLDKLMEALESLVEKRRRILRAKKEVSCRYRQGEIDEVFTKKIMGALDEAYLKLQLETVKILPHAESLLEILREYRRFLAQSLDSEYVKELLRQRSFGERRDLKRSTKLVELQSELEKISVSIKRLEKLIYLLQSSLGRRPALRERDIAWL